MNVTARRRAAYRSVFFLAASLCVFATAGTALSQQQDLDPSKFGLGDAPVEEEYYRANMLTLEALDALSMQKLGLESAAEFDARDRGWVTEPKNQGRCGSCWAFAAAGTIESRILKDNGPKYDISEQQQVSCNLLMHGCCGGNGRCLLFYYTNRPWLEPCGGYSESTTACPTLRTKNCSDFNCNGLGYLATGFYTVEKRPEAMKKSLVEHGPSYFRYDVYEDFYGYWRTPAPGAVYTQRTGLRRGGHAVLIIGWSDSKKAWLIKNSWGKNAGPNKDGTFWMAYQGHANDLKIQMFNLTGLSRTN